MPASIPNHLFSCRRLIFLKRLPRTVYLRRLLLLAKQELRSIYFHRRLVTPDLMEMERSSRGEVFPNATDLSADLATK